MGHPISPELNVFACLYLIVIKSDESGDLSILTTETAYNRITELDGKELNEVITRYLQMKMTKRYDF